MTTPLHGVLNFHSETGTEGGAWAFQDEKFMGLDAGQQFRCTRCGRVWNKDANPDEEPKPSFTYWRDATDPDSPYVGDQGGYFGEDTFDPDGNLGPGQFNQDYTRATNETSRQCAEDGHAGWENMYPNGMWSYEGLHILDDGDHLTVEDDGKVIFDDVVRLPPRQDPYAEGAYVAGGGFTAHRRPPVGTDEDWWFKGLRATLTIKD